MLKKVLKGALVGAGLLAMAATTQAADYEVNVYGASAEFGLFSNLAGDLCTGHSMTVNATGKDSSGKYGVTECSNANDTLTIRYASKASYDGIYSCYGETNVPGGQPTCAYGETRYAPDPYRTGASDTGFGPRRRMFYPTVADVVAETNPTCYYVNIGASDVPGYAFGQSSQGHQYGPFAKNGSNPVISRDVPAINDRAIFSVETDITDMDPEEVCEGMAVSFGFWVNDTVLGSHIQNITRPMAGIIFSGAATYWSDFDNKGTPSDFGTECPNLVDAACGNTYPNIRVIPCIRHAGSGTLATLFNTVLKTPVGGYSLAPAEVYPRVWFNDGSSELETCVRYNGGVPTTYGGAIGIIDCDRCDEGNNEIVCPATGATRTSDVTNYNAVDGGMRLVKYQGAVCSALNVQNGVYDYWSQQQVYFCDPDSHPMSVASQNWTSLSAELACSDYSSSPCFFPSGPDMRVERPTGMTGDVSPKSGVNWGTANPGPALWP